ncbi:MAG: hypothetical protein U0414_20260 [Polyangiaceae bacterium]
MRHTRLSRGTFALALLGLSACVGDPSIPDELEPSSVAAPADLGAFSDAGTRKKFELTLHDGADEDAFELGILDQGIDGNPTVTITASGDGVAPLDLSVSFACSDGSGGTSKGSTGGDPGLVFTTSCPGGGFFDDDDSGTAVIVVKRAAGASTAPMFYDLVIDVD